MLLLCAGTEIRALCSRLVKSANLCFHVMVCVQLLQTGGCFVASGSDAVKPTSLTLIKSCFSEHKIFLHQLLKVNQGPLSIS